MNAIDTVPLLRLLGAVPNQTLSRGEVIRQGIPESAIIEAQKRDQIFVTGIDNTRDGEKSSLATLLLTDVGETILDENE
jgi:hypothetical protein